MSFHQFIKPVSSFSEAQFEGDATIIASTANEHRLSLDGQEYRLFQYNWDAALSSGKWIKLGNRCTLWDESRVKSQYQSAPSSTASIDLSSIRPVRLSEIKVDPKLYIPIKTGTFLDEYWSTAGGIMPGTFTMVTGDPGIGKSSVLMDVLQNVAREDSTKKVLYISAEMTQVDMLDPHGFIKYYPRVAQVADFIFASDYLNSEINFATALEHILGMGYDLVVWDSIASIQTILLQQINSVGSRRAAETYAVDLMKKHAEGHNEEGRYTAHLLIQQVNKDGEFAGSKSLVHEITAFIKLKWVDDRKKLKYMVFDKNRRGGVGSRLQFKFTPDGISFDVEKFKDEKAIAEILDSDTNIMNELTQAELQDLLTGNSLSTTVGTETEEIED